MWFIHVSVLGQFSMELVKSRSNTNYLIPWCLGFSAYKIRTAMLISFGTAVRIVKVRTLFAHKRYSLGLRTNWWSLLSCPLPEYVFVQILWGKFSWSSCLQAGSYDQRRIPQAKSWLDHVILFHRGNFSGGLQSLLVWTPSKQSIDGLRAEVGQLQEM